jgi:hypothetical protein
MSANLGLDRRTLLRRGAIVGAGMVWTAPTVQSFARPAFAGTPVDDDVEDFKGISYVGVVFTCNATTYRAKFDVDTGWADVQGSTKGQWKADGHQGLPHCPKPAGWSTATGLTGNTIGGEEVLRADVTRVNGDVHQVRVTLLADACDFGDGQGVAMGAGGDKTNQGYCEAAVLIDSHTIVFTAK